MKNYMMQVKNPEKRPYASLVMPAPPGWLDNQKK